MCIGANQLSVLLYASIAARFSVTDALRKAMVPAPESVALGLGCSSRWFEQVVFQKVFCDANGIKGSAYAKVIGDDPEIEPGIR
jgi:hypothetical protein